MNLLPDSARAAVLDPADLSLTLRQFPLSSPVPGQALLKILRANICGTDIHMLRGEAFGKLRPPSPFVLGHEFVARVAALGEGLETDALGRPLARGDRVTLAYYQGCGGCPVCLRGQTHRCMWALAAMVTDCEAPPHFSGGFADYYLTRPGQRMVKLPEGLSDAVAAGCNCALAQVHQGLKEIGLRAGEQVVIQGAGGLGLYATAVAKARGAARVIVIDAVGPRLELARRMGADETIDLSAITDPRQRTARVKELTDGGADLCIEVVGKAAVLQEGLRMLQRGGRYLVMGAINQGDKLELEPALWIGANLSLHGVSLYDLDSLAAAVDFAAAHAGRLPLAELAGRTYELGDIHAACAQAAERSAIRVQLVMER